MRVQRRVVADAVHFAPERPERIVWEGAGELLAGGARASGRERARGPAWAQYANLPLVLRSLWSTSPTAQVPHANPLPCPPRSNTTNLGNACAKLLSKLSTAAAAAAVGAGAAEPLCLPPPAARVIVRIPGVAVGLQAGGRSTRRTVGEEAGHRDCSEPPSCNSARCRCRRQVQARIDAPAIKQRQFGACAHSGSARNVIVCWTLLFALSSRRQFPAYPSVLEDR